jgi:hypothetical protein
LVKKKKKKRKFKNAKKNLFHGSSVTGGTIAGNPLKA